MASNAMPQRSERQDAQKRKRITEDDGESNVSDKNDHEGVAKGGEVDFVHDMAEEYKNLHADKRGYASIEVRNISHKVEITNLQNRFTVIAKPLEMVYAPSKRDTNTGISIITYRTVQLARSTARGMNRKVILGFNDNLPMSVKQCSLLDRSNPAQVRVRLGLTESEDDRSEALPPQGASTARPVLRTPESWVVTVSNIAWDATSEDISRFFRMSPLPVVVISRSNQGRVQTARLVFDSAETASAAVHRFQGFFWPDEKFAPLILHQH